MPRRVLTGFGFFDPECGIPVQKIRTEQILHQIQQSGIAGKPVYTWEYEICLEVQLSFEFRIVCFELFNLGAQDLRLGFVQNANRWQKSVPGKVLDLCRA